MLLRNGHIYSPVDPSATAMLTVGDRIAWVGRDDAADTHAAVADEVLDLDRALVTPAFVDAHVHVLGTALADYGVDCAGATSLADFLDRISRYVTEHPGEPVGGQGWDEHNWPERRLPTAAELDQATAGAPALLSRVDGHSSLVSRALVDREPAIKDADGYEGTLVRRHAQTLAREAMQSAITPAQRRDLHRSALRRAASLGICAMHEMAAPHINSIEDVTALLDLAATEPAPDVVAYWGQTGEGLTTAVRLGAHGAAGDLTVDGSIGSHSARLMEPYADEPMTRGVRYLDLETAAQHVVTCTRAGLQAGFHCIGDDAVRLAIRAIGKAAEACGLDEIVAARHRLEHVEMISEELVYEMARLGVVASMQPAFDALWGGESGLYATRLGRRRALAANPFATFERAGVTLAFGSDSPVTPLGGWDAVRGAAFHHNPEHRMTLHDAFAAATRGGWRAAKVDDAGTLTPDALASYAVWQVPGDLVIPAPGGSASASAARALPDLTPGAPLPVCRRTVARGIEIFSNSS